MWKFECDFTHRSSGSRDLGAVVGKRFDYVANFATNGRIDNNYLHSGKYRFETFITALLFIR
jgi:hypothetical protein